ncbi:hypothetical protein FXO38_24015 [Capsicum annuum]|nr:hypothetical protein FXO37_30259 [Capsicum annuum]KAF3636741.1 hypothetical protein FXO38_24015 [Capsicum annuum]
MCTEIGKIQRQIHDASSEESDTPLKKKLDEFGNRLTYAIGIVCLVVWAINYKYFLSWDVEDGWPSDFRYSFEKCTYYFKIAVLLLLLLAYLLVQGKWHKRTQLVRKLPSVETLGCTTVICSDKQEPRLPIRCLCKSSSHWEEKPQPVQFLVSKGQLTILRMG